MLSPDILVPLPVYCGAALRFSAVFIHTAKMVVCYRMRSRTVTSMLSVRDYGFVFGCFYSQFKWWEIVKWGDDVGRLETRFFAVSLSDFTAFFFWSFSYFFCFPFFCCPSVVVLAVFLAVLMFSFFAGHPLRYWSRVTCAGWPELDVVFISDMMYWRGLSSVTFAGTSRLLLVITPKCGRSWRYSIGGSMVEGNCLLSCSRFDDSSDTQKQGEGSIVCFFAGSSICGMKRCRNMYKSESLVGFWATIHVCLSHLVRTQLGEVQGSVISHVGLISTSIRSYGCTHLRAATNCTRV